MSEEKNMHDQPSLKNIDTDRSISPRAAEISDDVSFLLTTVCNDVIFRLTTFSDDVMRFFAVVSNEIIVSWLVSDDVKIRMLTSSSDALCPWRVISAYVIVFRRYFSDVQMCSAILCHNVEIVGSPKPFPSKLILHLVQYFKNRTVKLYKDINTTFTTLLTFT